MNRHVIEFFKRNPDANACHLVLDKTYNNAKAASSYRKAINAKKVSVTTKDEFLAWKEAQQIEAPGEAVKESKEAEAE
jgi:hypothetical protein